MSDEVRKLAEQVALNAPLTHENLRERMLQWLDDELADGAPAAVLLVVQRQVEGKHVVRGASTLAGAMTALTASSILAVAGQHVARYMDKHQCHCPDCRQTRRVARLAVKLAGDDMASGQGCDA